MNKTQAEKALLKGHKVTHVSFPKHQWVRSRARHFGLVYQRETGETINATDFWIQYFQKDHMDNGWSIVKD